MPAQDSHVLEQQLSSIEFRHIEFRRVGFRTGLSQPKGMEQWNESDSVLNGDA